MTNELYSHYQSLYLQFSGFMWLAASSWETEHRFQYPTTCLVQCTLSLTKTNILISTGGSVSTTTTLQTSHLLSNPLTARQGVTNALSPPHGLLYFVCTASIEALSNEWWSHVSLGVVSAHALSAAFQWLNEFEMSR